MADHINGALSHLDQRDVRFVAISRAPLDKLLTYKSEWVGISLGILPLKVILILIFVCRFLKRIRAAGKVYTIISSKTTWRGNARDECFL